MTHKYTLDEIDEMSYLVKNKYLYGYYRESPFKDYFPYGGQMSRSYTESELTNHVEQRVRTLMAAGIRPEEMLDDTH